MNIPTLPNEILDIIIKEAAIEEEVPLYYTFKYESRDCGYIFLKSRFYVDFDPYVRDTKFLFFETAITLRIQNYKVFIEAGGQRRDICSYIYKSEFGSGGSSNTVFRISIAKMRQLVWEYFRCGTNSTADMFIDYRYICNIPVVKIYDEEQKKQIADNPYNKFAAYILLFGRSEKYKDLTRIQFDMDVRKCYYGEFGFCIDINVNLYYDKTRNMIISPITIFKYIDDSLYVQAFTEEEDIDNLQEGKYIFEYDKHSAENIVEVKDDFSLFRFDLEIIERELLAKYEYFTKEAANVSDEEEEICCISEY